MENRPMSATNGRIRPEGQGFAQKNTEESNWFSHDAKDTPAPAPVPNRSGTEETWYKHDENKNFVSPRPKSRTTVSGQGSKSKNTGSPTEWYRHEHGKTNGYMPPRTKSRLGSASAQAAKTRMRPEGPPVWASYDRNGTDATDGDSRPHSRLTDNEALSLQKKSTGSADNWFGHHDTNGVEEMMSPRRGSEEGQHNAQRLKEESGNWFNHDANKNYATPVKAPRCRSAQAREMIENTRGAGVDRVMHHEENGVNGNGYANGYSNGHIKPEAAEYAQKNVQGMMSKYIDQEGNQGYASARVGPRIKPEALANAEKNKGVMVDCLDGYLDTPKKHDARRVKPEGEDYAKRNRGVLDRALIGDLPGSGRKPMRVNGDGEKNAARNQGSGDILGGGLNGLAISGTPVKHRSVEAERNAARWRGGEMNSIFNMGN